MPVDRANAKAGLRRSGRHGTCWTRAASSRGLPEGARSLDGRLRRGHTGVASLALASGAPVVTGGRARHRPGAAEEDTPGVPRLRRVTVAPGHPLDLLPLRGLRDQSNVIRRAVTDEVMDAIARLSTRSTWTGTTSGRPPEGPAPHQNEVVVISNG